jgi:flavorubredoxin/nanoRNase/pAp phosphatase (c-di-AMP/oligoRNAs hydrolase)
MICQTIYKKGEHEWLVFGQDPEKPANLADTNQVLIVDDGQAMLVDPGGFETFPSVLAALTERVPVEAVKRIFLSRQDPDVASSVPLWLRVCSGGVDVVTSQLWQDVVTHLDAGCSVTPIPDEGMDIPVGANVSVSALAAHYLPSPGGFHLYDAEARALYTGAVGSAMPPPEGWNGYVVQDFDAHAELMRDWHQRWMPSDAARDAWLSKVASLDLDLLVPQRGMVFKGDNVARFIDWFAGLRLGSAVQVAMPQAPSSSDQDLIDEIAGLQERTEAAPVAELEPEAESPPVVADAEGAEAAAIDIDDMFAELLGTSKDEWVAPTGDPEPGAGYRLVTRSDFDGLVCAVLFEQLNMIDDILFVHPNDMQEGRVDIQPTDITTNLPYVPGCHLAFDHHLSEVKRLGQKFENHIINPDAPSAARVVYEYYGAQTGFPKVSVDLMEAVDKGDAAQFDMDEVLYADGWPLLNFVMDSRTGLGRFRGFRIPNYELMMSLIEWCQEYSVEEILELPDVKERVDLYREQEPLFKQQIERCTTVHGNLAVLDLLEEETVYVGNRFMIYALFPQCNISMHVMWGRDKQNVVYAVGKSIFDRSSKTNVGELMLQYGGGGHGAAGTCQSDPAMAEIVKQALIAKINDDG